MQRTKSDKDKSAFINTDNVMDDDAVLEELGYVVRILDSPLVIPH